MSDERLVDGRESDRLAKLAERDGCFVRWGTLRGNRRDYFH